MSEVLPILQDLCSPLGLPVHGQKTAFLSMKGRTLLLGRLRESQPRCSYCGTITGRHTSSLDHVIPTSRGGVTATTNMVLCCFRCNNLKDSRTGDEFIADLLAAAERFRKRLRRPIVAGNTRELPVIRELVSVG